MTNLFLMILNMGISACFVICAIMIMRLFSGKAPKWLRCGLWILVAFRLICPFSFKSCLSIIPEKVTCFFNQSRTDLTVFEKISDTYTTNVPLTTTRVNSVSSYTKNQLKDISKPMQYTAGEAVVNTDIQSFVSTSKDDNTYNKDHENSSVSPDNEYTANNITIADETAIAFPAKALSSFKELEAKSNRQIGIFDIISYIWLFGAIFLFIYYVFSYHKTKKTVSGAVSIKVFNTSYTDKRQNIMVSENINTPFVLGIIHPKIFIPLNLDINALPYVLEHEKKHIYRKDNVWKAVGFFLLAIHWFNPLVWISYYLFIRDIEAACDEAVIVNKSKEEVREYAIALLNCSMQKANPILCSIAFGEISVKKRIKDIADYKKPSLKVILSCLLVSTLITACTLTDPAVKATSVNEPDSLTGVESDKISFDVQECVPKENQTVHNAEIVSDTIALSKNILPERNQIRITKSGEIAYLLHGAFHIDESLFDYSEETHIFYKKDNIPTDTVITEITDDDLFLTVLDINGKIHSTYPYNSKEARNNDNKIYRLAQEYHGNVGTGRSDPDIVQDLEVMENIVNLSGNYSYYYTAIDNYGRVIRNGSRIYSGEEKAVQAVDRGIGSNAVVLLENGKIWGAYDNGDYYHNAIKNWRCITKLYSSGDNVLGLCMDGSIVSYKKSIQYRLSTWKDITSLGYCNGNIVGADKNGRVYFYSENSFPYKENDTQPTLKEICSELNTWENVLAVDCNSEYIVGLTEEGIKILNMYKK